MPRFVILEHDHPELHWDLMLEAGDVLQTWRLAQPPVEGVFAIEATRLADHRRIYLDYEGPVSGNRGCVRRWDAGEYSACDDSDSQSLRFRLRGENIEADVLLEHREGCHWWFRRLVMNRESTAPSP